MITRQIQLSLKFFGIIINFHNRHQSAKFIYVFKYVTVIKVFLFNYVKRISVRLFPFPSSCLSNWIAGFWFLLFITDSSQNFRP